MFKFSNRGATLAVAASCLALGGAFSAAMAATGPNEAPDTFTPDQGVQGSDISAARTKDKTNGQEWRVVAYTSKDDSKRCVSALPVEGDQIGLYDGKGRFKPVTLNDGAGSCGDLSKGTSVVSWLPFAKDGKPRVVAYGTLAPGVKGLRVTNADGVTTVADLGPERTYVAVSPVANVAPEKQIELKTEQQLAAGTWTAVPNTK